MAESGQYGGLAQASSSSTAVDAHRRAVSIAGRVRRVTKMTVVTDLLGGCGLEEKENGEHGKR